MARFVAAASLVLTALSVALLVQNREVAGARDIFEPVSIVIAVCYPLVGAWAAEKGGRCRRIGPLLSVCACMSLAVLAEQYSRYEQVAGRGSLAVAGWVGWAGAWLAVPGLLLPRTLLVLLLPTGAPRSSGWRPVAVMLGVLVAVSTVATAADTATGAAHLAGSGAGAILGVPQPEGFARRLAVAVLLLGGPLALAGLIDGYRRSGPDERRSLGVCVVAGSFVVFGPVVTLPVPLWLYQAVGVAAVLAVAASIVAAASRDGFDLAPSRIDSLISAVVLHALMFAAVVATYLVVSSLVGALAAAGIVVMVAGLAWRYAARTVGAVVDRLGQGGKAYALLRELGQRLETTRPPTDALPDIAGTVASALHLPYVRVEVGHGDDITAAAEAGQVSGEPPVRIPMRYRSETVGWLSVAPARGVPLQPSVMGLLRAVADQAGVAAFAARSMKDLQRSREQLVTAREEEKARLSAHLHRDVKQDLTAVMLGMDAARNYLVAGNPDLGLKFLAEAKSCLQNARDDIRRLSRDLRPPALDELGLVGALQELARLFELAPDAPQLLVNLPDDRPQLSHALELAIYRIAQEGLCNVSDHTRAGRCELDLTVTEAFVRLTIVNDGAPWQRTAEGLGISLMRRCAEELDGEFNAGPTGQLGWLVQAKLPILRP
ncbi:histidine kinase [Pseudonocardia sp.]|uniref:sensor histidine kinase n=1 Tax=Pseudonocardia sp. TaxID=60912 RepID=UPI0031FCF30D